MCTQKNNEEKTVVTDNSMTHLRFSGQGLSEKFFMKIVSDKT